MKTPKTPDLSDMNPGTPNRADPVPLAFQTLNVRQAADFLKCCPQTVIKLVREGKLAGRKVGRAWVFLIDDLVMLIRSGNNIECLPVPCRKEITQWHCTNVEKRTGSVLQHQTEKELDALLEPATGRKRNSSSTN